MLSGKVIKGINAGNAVFHHRTMQIIARQQTICWQWPFFCVLKWYRRIYPCKCCGARAKALQRQTAHGPGIDGQVVPFCWGSSRPWMWVNAPQGWEGFRTLPAGDLQGQLPTRGTWGVQPWLRQGGVIPQFPSQALSWSNSRHEGKPSCLQRQPCSTQVGQAGHLCGGQQHHNCAWPIVEGETLCLVWHTASLPPSSHTEHSRDHSSPHSTGTHPSGWVNQAGTKPLLPPLWPPDRKHLSSSQANI